LVKTTDPDQPFPRAHKETASELIDSMEDVCMASLPVVERLINNGDHLDVQTQTLIRALLNWEGKVQTFHNQVGSSLLADALSTSNKVAKG